MQTIPGSYPKLEKLYTSAPSLNLPNSTIVQLDMKEFKGSCCDNGRYEVTDCGRWWYQCGEWGLKVIIFIYLIIYLLLFGFYSCFVFYSINRLIFYSIINV